MDFTALHGHYISAVSFGSAMHNKLEYEKKKQKMILSESISPVIEEQKSDKYNYFEIDQAELMTKKIQNDKLNNLVFSFEMQCP